MDAFIGTVMPWSINWAPENWLLCNGQLISVSQYQALFSLISNVYGGDGNSTFAVPDLRTRIPIGADNLNYQWGKSGGAPTSDVTFEGTGGVYTSFTLTPNQLPSHSHGIPKAVIPVTVPANTTQNADQSIPSPSTILGIPNFSDGLSDVTVNTYSTAPADSNLTPATVNYPGGITGSTGQGAQVIAGVDMSALSGSSGTIQPWITMYYIICVYGIYPPRP
jgi:microcystin-dependent protein